jgi:hypothetical protein
MDALHACRYQKFRSQVALDSPRRICTIAPVGSVFVPNDLQNRRQNKGGT